MLGSGAELILDGRFPAILGFEEEFDEFADCASASWGMVTRWAGVPNLGGGVGRAGGQAGDAHGGQVGQVVAHEGGVGGFEVEFGRGVSRKAGQFFGSALDDGGDAEFGGAEVDDFGGSAGEDGDLFAGLPPERRWPRRRGRGSAWFRRPGR